jgi:zinc transport system permease protein
MEMLSYTFMQRALLAALLVGLICSGVAFFVVLKRLSFLGVGVSHTALGGIAVGLVAGVNPILTGSLFAVAAAVVTGSISRLGRFHEDTVIGVFYAAGMAFGITLISSAKGYYPELFSLLFGNILAVSAADLRLLSFVLLGTALFLSLFFKELLALSFDEEMARAGGVPVNALYLGLLAVMALTVMVSVKLVGIVLASALLVIPAATGYRLSSNYRTMLAVSLICGATGSVGGLVLSYYFRVPSGATIVLAMTILFLLSLLVGPRFFARRKSKRAKQDRLEETGQEPCR